MLPIPRRYAHFVFAIVQSGLTCAIAAAIATLRAPDATFAHWLGSWIIAWVIMTPVVMLAAPSIKTFSVMLTREQARTPR